MTEVATPDTRHPTPDAAAAPPSPRARFFWAAARGNRPPFRGGAVENLGGAPMGKGHGNNGQPFDINTACYLKPVFDRYDQARKNRRRLVMVVMGAVKSLKSFAQEAGAADHVCNATGDVALFFGSENAADTTGTTRILDFYRGVHGVGGIPRFKDKMETIVDRNDITMGAIKFPDKTLFILSANLGNTQQKNLAFMGVQDAFVLGNNGMITEAIARTTQYEKECIIWLESQGGEAGFDFDERYKATNQQELHVVCPCCGTAHVFNWKAFDMTRPEDFEAVLPRRKAWEIIKKHTGPENMVAKMRAWRAHKWGTSNIQHSTPNIEQGAKAI